MSRSRHKLHSLGVGFDDLSVVDAGNMRLMTSLPLAQYLPGAASPTTADWAPALDAALAQAEVPETGDLSLTVSDAWTRYFMLNIPVGVGSLAELRMLAEARFESLYGVAPEGWHLAADWKPAGRVLVCALPERLLQVARDLGASGKGRQVRSIQPHALRLVRIFHKQISDDCWLGCFSARSLVALRISGGEVVHVRRFPLSQLPAADELGAMLEGESLRAGLEMPAALCVLGMLPELAQGERVCGMQVALAQGHKVLRGRPGQTSESVHLAMQGAVA